MSTLVCGYVANHSMLKHLLEINLILKVNRLVVSMTEMKQYFLSSWFYITTYRYQKYVILECMRLILSWMTIEVSFVRLCLEFNNEYFLYFVWERKMKVVLSSKNVTARLIRDSICYFWTILNFKHMTCSWEVPVHFLTVNRTFKFLRKDSEKEYW